MPKKKSRKRRSRTRLESILLAGNSPGLNKKKAGPSQFQGDRIPPPMLSQLPAENENSDHEEDRGEPDQTNADTVLLSIGEFRANSPFRTQMMGFPALKSMKTISGRCSIFRDCACENSQLASIMGPSPYEWNSEIDQGAVYVRAHSNRHIIDSGPFSWD